MGPGTIMTSRDVDPPKRKRVNLQQPAMVNLGLRPNTEIPFGTDPMDKPAEQGVLKQHARMADRKAALMISGAACVDPKMVWVTLEGGGSWFDKKDETRLMTVAWDTLEKDDNLGESMIQRTGGDSGRVDRNATRLEHITAVLKQYRRQQLSMHVQSISPAAEECMSGLVIDLVERNTQLSDMADPVITQTNPHRDPLVEHDDKIRRITRIMRRLPVCRNHFCRVAGCILAYKLCLQEGSACTTRRLNQVQLDMRIGKLEWLRYVNAHFDEMFDDISSVYNKDQSIYVYDWATAEMRRLDSDQFEVVQGERVQGPVDSDAEERRGGQDAFYG
jgi:hypothetical protein